MKKKTKKRIKTLLQIALDLYVETLALANLSCI